jgi:hypothetical protein
MDFAFGQTVFRDRRTPVTDPYNPDKTVPGSWADVDTIEIPSGFVASSSSSSLRGATRQQVLTDKSLFLSDPTADVVPGDRVRVGGTMESGGVAYYVHARPDADVNPFTGWQPVVEIPLELTEG